ncbi:hypothetical protein LTR13_008824 [Exophiala sideris]|nr:hypothetical protein LTR13_008824 [Exophiala sideris]
MSTNTPSSSQSDPSSQDTSVEQNQAHNEAIEKIVRRTIFTFRYVILGSVSQLAPYYRELDKEKSEKRFFRRDALALTEYLMVREPFHRPNTPQLWLRDQFFLYVIRQSSFNCIGHFMAAMKAVVFQDISDYTNESVDKKYWDITIDDAMGTNRSEVPSGLYDGPLFAILRSSNPHRQTSRARLIGSYNESVWRSIADSVVVAAIICRAMVEPLFKRLIVATDTREFVYASREDGYWGTGHNIQSFIRFRRTDWTGRNRLGWCYGRAREYLQRKSFTNGSSDGQ